MNFTKLAPNVFYTDINDAKIVLLIAWSLLLRTMN
jgi:hypothetical protein